MGRVWLCEAFLRSMEGSPLMFLNLMTVMTSFFNPSQSSFTTPAAHYRI